MLLYSRRAVLDVGVGTRRQRQGYVLRIGGRRRYRYRRANRGVVTEHMVAYKVIQFDLRQFH